MPMFFSLLLLSEQTKQLRFLCSGRCENVFLFHLLAYYAYKIVNSLHDSVKLFYYQNIIFHFHTEKLCIAGKQKAL